MTRTRGRRPLACHHEAGHAVARWWLGFHTDDAMVLSGDQLRSGAGREDCDGEEHFDAEGIVNGLSIAFVLGRLSLDGLDGDRRAWMERQGARRVEMALVANATGALAEADRRAAWDRADRMAGVRRLVATISAAIARAEAVGAAATPLIHI